MKQAFETKAYSAMSLEDDDGFLEDMQERAELKMIEKRRKQQPKQSRYLLQDSR